MSTPIINHQTIRNVAGTLYKARTNSLDLIQKSANDLTRALTHGADLDSVSELEALDMLYGALLDANINSVIQRYPDNTEYIDEAQKYRLEAGNVDIKRDAIILQSPDSLIFFIRQMDRIRQGLEGAIYDALSPTMDTLEQNLAISLGMRNFPLYNTQAQPSIADIVDKIQKLSTHGDYLYGADRGFSNITRQLELVALSPGIPYSQDLLVGLLEQAYESKPMTLPVGTQPFTTGQVSQYANPNYRISSDIPIPSQSDADQISRAMIFLAHRFDVVSTIDTDGKPVDDATKNNIQSRLMAMAVQHTIRSNTLRFSEFEGADELTYSDALKHKKAKNTPSNAVFLVSIDETHDWISATQAATDPRLSKNAQEIKETLNTNKGKVMMVANEDNLIALKDRFPALSVKEFNVSLTEMQQIKQYSHTGTPLSASEVLMRHAIQSAHENLGLDILPEMGKGPITTAMVKELQTVIPGTDDVFAEAVKNAVSRNYPSYSGLTPQFIVDDILRELPKPYRDNIRTPGYPREINPELSVTREREHCNLPLSTPSLRR
ncbi:hypothetical protein [Alteromonas sp. 14N.309.X.WAT.G.H12]|uniref:hypothetical protein n=1 Tax=Alteromonas sp. 14N.309.X.WAT.G.H12 TaxID=3120824 RepID=UPI002FD64FAA